MTISIHVPAKRTTSGCSLMGLFQSNFNPRSREGSDLQFVYAINKRCFISIHAPAKGATRPAGSVWPRLVISIHAPVKGATSELQRMGRYHSISIHAPVKGATAKFNILPFLLFISIHAPVKGATRLLHGPVQPATYFNPRSREGSDFGPADGRKGEVYFNPRSREGSDS